MTPNTAPLTPHSAEAQRRPGSADPRGTGRGWAYSGAVLGGVVSIAANVAHSYVPPAVAAPGWSPQPGAVIGAVFWPVALFMALEILARTRWPDQRRWLAVRWLGLLPVALVAAVVSYRHLSGLLTFYGEDSLTATVGPLAVDGLMVMATGALLATAAGRADRAVRPVSVSAGGVGRPPLGRLDSAVQPEVGQRLVVRPPVGRLDGAVQRDGVGQPTQTQPSTGPGMPGSTRPGRDDDLSGLSGPASPAGSPRRQATWTDGATVGPSDAVEPGVVQPERPPVVQPDRVLPDAVQPVQPVQPDSAVQPGVGHHGPSRSPAAPVGRPVVQRVGQAEAETPIERALGAAAVHRVEHGALPSVTQLAGLADVARGTAATALKQLRDQPDDRRHGLQLIHDEHTGTSR